MSAQQDLQELLRLLKARNKSMMNALKQANALQAKGLKRFAPTRLSSCFLEINPFLLLLVALRRLLKRHWQLSKKRLAHLMPRKQSDCTLHAKTSSKSQPSVRQMIAAALQQDTPRSQS
jgi:hypothetical protein